jgi:hypothetical protein
MSDNISTVNFVLGIVGTITGAIALFISYWAFKKENPKLEIRTVKCEHSVRVSTKNIKTLSFWTQLEVKNVGDRGTSINDAQIEFEDSGKKYIFKKQYFEDATSRNVWINPHETTYIGVQFWGAFDGADLENLNCTLKVYHTHGCRNVTVTSRRISNAHT